MIDHESSFGLTNKVALVTDIESPSGYAIAKALVKAGAQVHGVSSQHEICARRINRLRRWGMATGHVVDLRSGVAALQFAYQFNEELPRLHILISNFRIAPNSSVRKHLSRTSVGPVEILAEMALVQELLGSLRDAGTTSDPARVVLVGTFLGDAEQSVVGIPQDGGTQRLGAYARNVSNRLKQHRVNFSFFEPTVRRETSAGSASACARAALVLVNHLSSEAVV